jgi:hypothetical protein
VSSFRRSLAAATAVALLALGGTAAAAPQKIPGPLDGPLPLFTGAATTAQPLHGPYPKYNPALAPDGRSGSGLAAGNGSATPLAGPLGKGTTRSSALNPGGCASFGFDQHDRLIAACNSPFGPSLSLFDPKTLSALATMMLPGKGAPDPTALLALNITDFAGGTHFIVKADGSLVVPTNDGRLLYIKVGSSSLSQTAVTDLKGSLGSGQKVFAVGSGFDGFDWAVGNKGTVVTVPHGGGTPRGLALREAVAEDIATDPTGAYVVTANALYRLQAASDGTPRVVWRQPLLGGLADQHAGRIHAGSGTPPAIVPGGFVAVADSVNPPRVNVMRISGPDSRRLACAVPVFHPGSGSVEAQLVVAGHSLVVSNAYGYDNLSSTELGRTTTGGMARIVVGKHGCHTAWTSDLISPSAQAVVSRNTGLLYTLQKTKGAPDYWGLAAVDWRTGKLRFSVLAGEGLGFNSNGGAVILGPDATAYAGSFGGVIRWHDR